MKHPFIKKIMNLLEKEVCQEELCKEVFSSQLFKPLTLDRKDVSVKTAAAAKHSNQETTLAEGVIIKGSIKLKKLIKM